MQEFSAMSALPLELIKNNSKGRRKRKKEKKKTGTTILVNGNPLKNISLLFIVLLAVCIGQHIPVFFGFYCSF
jgi:hypothetical protein